MDEVKVGDTVVAKGVVRAIYLNGYFLENDPAVSFVNKSQVIEHIPVTPKIEPGLKFEHKSTKCKYTIVGNYENFIIFCWPTSDNKLETYSVLLNFAEEKFKEGTWVPIKEDN